MLRMLGILTARVMIDSDASHNETWVTLITEYLHAGVTHAHALKVWHPMLRLLVHRFVPGYAEVQRQLNLGRSIVVDGIRKVEEREKNGVPEPQPTSVLHHMSRRAPGTSSVVIDMYLKEQLNLAFGGIHTTSAVLTQTLFELSAHPNYVPELRKEIIDTLVNFDGVFSISALWDMQKLDSFIRETHRLSSPNLTTLQKRATQDVTLSDGTFIPSGTKLEFPTFAIHRDGKFFDNAAEFDGFRFLKFARKDMLGWGLCKTAWACPGRFLADIEIKLVVAFILMNYDTKNPDGQGRHSHVHFENQVFHDPVNPVLMKRIRREDIDENGHLRE
ncbi:hypothetical protein CSAL01_00306 [Colletotrichum salicis]|uniref:Cytochrome P450 n=1 Tax=Colletotrichum salicis TaxID=1209931 RepID=A0A135RSR0_9PEZI|nr:hypothetical protein CSAL01_00306 [Colletotrichum salicis]